MGRTRVILVTDGDVVAQQALQFAAVRLGLRCISMSGGNPTVLSGLEIVGYIEAAAYDPVLVMVDDKGNPGRGAGERAALYIAQHPAIELLGVIAVASETNQAAGIKVNYSITADGEVSERPVNKDGQPLSPRRRFKGDTVDFLNEFRPPLVVGIGDIGKMGGADHLRRGVPITCLAIELILAHHGLGPYTPYGAELRQQVPLGSNLL